MTEILVDDKETGENTRIGEGRPGPGRPKGVPNKATTAVREAVAKFAEANVEKLQTWIDAVAKKDPAKAADLYLRAIEYFIPKLARTELTHDPATAEPRTITVQFVDGDGKCTGEHEITQTNGENNPQGQD